MNFRRLFCFATNKDYIFLAVSFLAVSTLAVSFLEVSAILEVSDFTESVVVVELEPLQAAKEAITRAKAAIFNEFFMLIFLKVTI